MNILELVYFYFDVFDNELEKNIGGDILFYFLMMMFMMMYVCIVILRLNGNCIVDRSFLG